MGSRATSSETEKAVLEQRVQLLQKELDEAQETRSKDMAKRLQAQAKFGNGANTALFFEQIEQLETQNTKLQKELDTLNLKHEREKQELTSESKKLEYTLIEDKSKMDIEVQKLRLENQKVCLEKDSEMEKLKSKMEKELKEIKEAYQKEKTQMDSQLEQANIHTKALQMLNANETYGSPVSALLTVLS